MFSIYTQFQFTPLREGRPNSTPAAVVALVFQFTPLREGRLAAQHQLIVRSYFNSRPSARGDHDVAADRRFRVEISIHAPPRGATCAGKCFAPAGAFQFTPLREGRRLSSATAPASGVLFQFTPLREGRRLLWGCPSTTQYFNSRPSARGDACGCATANHQRISIHAPPRGATIGGGSEQAGRCISIHAPPRGATP